MTETEWLASLDYRWVLSVVFERPVTTRKCVLADCACYRRVWPLLTDVQREAVVRLEAACEVDPNCLLLAMEAGIDAWQAAVIAGQAGRDVACEREEQARLLKDVFGNPYRRVVFDAGWRSETVLALARGIYADHGFDRVPVLADALEDAGCDHPDVLGHLRGPGPHARGCWVVDEVLGKS